MEIYNYVTVGLLSYDEIINEGKSSKIFGGSVLYASIQASLLSKKAAIISAIGSNELISFKELLKHYGLSAIDLKVYEGPTLSFINEYYEANKRRQKVRNFKPLKIDLKSLSYFETGCLHLGPILDELDLHSLEEVELNSDLIVLDAQGLCRTVVNEDVKPKNVEDTHFLSSIDILKCNLEELFLISKCKDVEEASLKILEKGCKILVTTLGEKGSFVFSKEGLFYFPPYKPNKVVDPTGAGDVFLSSFSISFIDTKELRFAGLFASSASSFAVEGLGFSSLANKKTILERIEEQRIKEMKMNFKELKGILNKGLVNQ